MNRKTDRLKALKKHSGEAARSTIVGHDTLARIGKLVDNIMNDVARLKGDKASTDALLDKAYNLMGSIYTNSSQSKHFIDSVIRKLVKVAGGGGNEDDEEMKVSGTRKRKSTKKFGDTAAEETNSFEEASLDDLMINLELQTQGRRIVPELKLAIMLWKMLEEPPSSVVKSHSASSMGATFESPSFDGASTGGSRGTHNGANNATVGLPTTGMRGTMISTRNVSRGGHSSHGHNRGGNAGILNDYVFLQVTGEIVDEENYFNLFGSDLVEDGVRIPTARDFVDNPKEEVPFNLVSTKVAAAVSKTGSRGPCGGLEESVKAKSIINAMISDLCESNDVSVQIKDLPPQRRNPFLGEVQQKLPLMTTLQAAFDLFDVDASGTLTNSEVTNALKMIGLSYKDASVKRFLQNLDRDGDGEVDMREFLSGLDSDMAKKISDALETNENMIIQLRAQRQAKMQEIAAGHTKKEKANVGLNIIEVTGDVYVEPSIEEVEVIDEDKAVADAFAALNEEEKEEQARAAMAIQSRSRIRNAKRDVGKQRFKMSDEGKEMDKAALMIQSRSRQRKARQDLHAAAEKKKKYMSGEARLSEELRAMVPTILEETVYNLLREAIATDVQDEEVRKLENNLIDLEAKVDHDLRHYDEIENHVDDEETTDKKKLAEKKRESKKRATQLMLLKDTIDTRRVKVEEMTESLSEMKMQSRFDLNLKPKTFVRVTNNNRK